MRRKQENRYKISIEKELKLAERQEDALRRAAVKQEVPRWRTALEEKVPEKIYGNLKKAFCKAFQIVFEKGGGIIEKTYDRESIREDQEIRAFAFQIKGDRKSLKSIRKDASASTLRNMAVTSLEGIGLGALGIGLPDIVLFVGILLKGIYEIALRYGYDYTSDGERYFILKLMEGSMQKGEAWEECSREVDELAAAGKDLNGTPEAVKDQIPHTAEAFAADMVVLKFIQGLPVVGILGGAGNPVYYRRVMKYAELKYRRRYLLELQKCVESAQEGMGE